MNAITRYVLYTTVFITGAAVLVIEVTAVRLLSPFFGSSLFVLSSVLTIILGALSLGYYVGGRISDRFPFHEPLYTVIAVSGLSVLLTQLIAGSALPLHSASLSIISGPLIFSFVLFFIPAFLLGIVSPYIIKLQSEGTPREHVGSVVGATFFWGTVGSIIGSLLTGFLLVPLYGVQHSIIGTGFILVLLGLGGNIAITSLKEKSFAVYRIVDKQGKYIVLIALLSLIVFVLIEETSVRPDRNVLLESDGLYSHILVYEGQHAKGTIHLLERDANNSSAILQDSFDLIFGYSQFAEYYPLLQEKTDNFLLIGGGAYSIPRTLVARDENIVVDVVEIEPVLFDIAKEYFDLKDTTRINNYVMDGRVFLAKSDTKYDVIFGDAFGTSLSVPEHLTTKEFLLEVQNSLTPDGIYFLNYIGAFSDDAPTLTGSLVKTLVEVFPNFKMYSFNKANPQSKQNIMFVARNGETEIDFGDQNIFTTGGQEFFISELEISSDRIDFDRELVLIDDRAPVEYLMAKQL